MTVAALLAVAIGVVIPLLVSLITKLNASAKLKSMLSAVLAAIASGISGALATPPQGTGQWEQVGISVAIAIGSAVLSYLGLWKPTGAAAAIDRATPNFGLGAP